MARILKEAARSRQRVMGAVGLEALLFHKWPNASAVLVVKLESTFYVNFSLLCFFKLIFALGGLPFSA